MALYHLAILCMCVCVCVDVCLICVLFLKALRACLRLGALMLIIIISMMTVTDALLSLNHWEGCMADGGNADPWLKTVYCRNRRSVRVTSSVFICTACIHFIFWETCTWHCFFSLLVFLSTNWSSSHCEHNLTGGHRMQMKERAGQISQIHYELQWPHVHCLN